MLNLPLHALLVMEQRRNDLMAEVDRERQLEIAQPPADPAPSRLRQHICRLAIMCRSLHSWVPATTQQATDHASTST